jgi:hypothetical protein
MSSTARTWSVTRVSAVALANSCAPWRLSGGISCVVERRCCSGAAYALRYAVSSSSRRHSLSTFGSEEIRSNTSASNSGGTLAASATSSSMR